MAFLVQVLILGLMYLVCCDAQGHLPYTVQEESPRGTFVANLTKDTGLEGMYSQEDMTQIRFAFLNSAASRENLFDLDRETGILRTAQVIDRDVICAYMPICDINLDVQLMPSAYFRIIKVQITVVDINDNTPIFTEAVLVKSLPESSQPGTARLNLPMADDPDGPQFGIVKYEIVPPSDVFSLQDGSGSGGVEDLQLVLTKPLDREQVDFYSLHVMAIDGGAPPKNGSLRVNILIIDVNDNSPRFENETYNVNIEENIPNMSTILQVNAWDPDLGINGDVVYGFSEITEANFGDKFIINEDTGEIMLVGSVDHEEKDSYTLFVTARDKHPNSVPTRTTVIVNIIDLNDHAPNILIKTELVNGRLSIPENAPVDTFVAHISVTDADAGVNGVFTCELDSAYFHLDKMYSTDYKMVTVVSFDREKQSTHAVQISCQDSGENSARSMIDVFVEITDVNDNSPMFEPLVSRVDMPEANELGALVTKVTAKDADSGENGTVSYSFIDNHGGIFSINSITGVISTNVILDREQVQELTLTVLATDHGVPPQSGTGSVVINIVDIDDEIPTFNQSVYEFKISENQPKDTVIGQIQAIDKDQTPNNEFIYKIFEQAPITNENLFSIDPQTGIIKTEASLDHELYAKHSLLVSATSTNTDHIVSYASVEVEVLDLNDNPPEITFPSPTNNTIYIDPAKTYPGLILAQVKAFDRDSGLNQACEYRLGDETEIDALSLDPTNGTLSVINDFQNHENKELIVDIVVMDCGTPRLNSSRSLIISFQAHKKNLTIVIIILSITCPVVVILIILILWALHKRRKLDQKYNWMARMADQRIKVSTSLPIKNNLGSTEAILSSMDSILSLADDNDVKTAMDPALEFDDVPDKRMIEGQESRPREIWEAQRKLKTVNEQGNGYDSPVHIQLNNPYSKQKIVYQTDYTVKKPVAYNPNIDLSHSPSGESESVHSGGDSGRGSAISDSTNSSPGQAWSSLNNNKPDDHSAPYTSTPILDTSDAPAISTWGLSPGVHHCDALRLSSSLSVTDSLNISPPQSFMGEGDKLTSRDRQTLVRFSLPPDERSLASTCSDDHLSEKMSEC